MAAHPQFDALDTDKDGKLTFSEMGKSQLLRKSHDTQATFSLIDVNGDGYVSVVEFHEYRLKNKKK